MRKFLIDIKIVGAVLVYQEGRILYYTIPNLLKWCDWVLLMFDNPDKTTKKIALKYQRKYPDRIRIANTGIAPPPKEFEKMKGGLVRYFKRNQGPIRETVFQYMRDCLKKGEKVDILLYPDGDEIFSNSLPNLLEGFWALEQKRAISMKPIDVFGNLRTIVSRSMTGHTRIMKFAPDITAIPYRTTCFYRPFTKRDRIASNRILIHLAALSVERRNWRRKHWQAVPRLEYGLWKTDRKVTKMTPDEILHIMKKPFDTTVGEYLKKCPDN